MNQVTAIAFTFAGDALDVFWINAEARDSWFHKCFSLVVTKVWNLGERQAVVVR